MQPVRREVHLHLQQPLLVREAGELTALATVCRTTLAEVRLEVPTALLHLRGGGGPLAALAECRAMRRLSLHFRERRCGRVRRRTVICRGSRRADPPRIVAAVDRSQWRAAGEEERRAGWLRRPPRTLCWAQTPSTRPRASGAGTNSLRVRRRTASPAGGLGSSGPACVPTLPPASPAHDRAGVAQTLTHLTLRGDAVLRQPEGWHALARLTRLQGLTLWLQVRRRRRSGGGCQWRRACRLHGRAVAPCKSYARAGPRHGRRPGSARSVHAALQLPGGYCACGRWTVSAVA